MKKLYPVCEIYKLKRSNLNIAEAHNLRKIKVPTADGSNNYYRKINHSSGSLKIEIDRLIKLYKINRVQKNSNVALEIVCGASRDYFLKEKHQHYKDFSPVRIERWLKASIDFLNNEFPDQIVSLDVHEDETTPHLHAIVFPPSLKSVKKVGRKAKDSISKVCDEENRYCLDFGRSLNKYKLSYYLDQYSNFTKHLGLVRPEKNLRATHVKLKKFYEDLYKKQCIEKELKYLERKIQQHKLKLTSSQAELALNQKKMENSKAELTKFALKLKTFLNIVANSAGIKDFQHLKNLMLDIQKTATDTELDEIEEVVPDVLVPSM